MKLALVVDVGVVTQFARFFVCATIWRPNPTERTLKGKKVDTSAFVPIELEPKHRAFIGFLPDRFWATATWVERIKQHFIKRSIVERVNISCEAREIFFLFSNWP